MGIENDIADVQDTHFEDELDMLEYTYEKIELTVYLWSTWVKSFLEEFNEEVSRKLLIEMVENIHMTTFPKVTVGIQKTSQESILYGFIRRFGNSLTENAKSQQKKPQ